MGGSNRHIRLCRELWKQPSGLAITSNAKGPGLAGPLIFCYLSLLPASQRLADAGHALGVLGLVARVVDIVNTVLEVVGPGIVPVVVLEMAKRLVLDVAPVQVYTPEVSGVGQPGLVLECHTEPFAALEDNLHEGLW